MYTYPLNFQVLVTQSGGASRNADGIRVAIGGIDGRLLRKELRAILELERVDQPIVDPETEPIVDVGEADGMRTGPVQARLERLAGLVPFILVILVMIHLVGVPEFPAPARQIDPALVEPAPFHELERQFPS